MLGVQLQPGWRFAQLTVPSAFLVLYSRHIVMHPLLGTLEVGGMWP